MNGALGFMDPGLDSTQRVAHTSIMLVLGFSSSMQRQQVMLTMGDRSNFTKRHSQRHVIRNN